jgi:hypothetical protein
VDTGQGLYMPKQENLNMLNIILLALFNKDNNERLIKKFIGLINHATNDERHAIKTFIQTYLSHNSELVHELIARAPSSWTKTDLNYFNITYCDTSQKEEFT